MVDHCVFHYSLQNEDYVARRPAHPDTAYEAHYHGTVDFHVGHFAPGQGVGKFVVSVNSKERVGSVRRLA